MSQIGTPEPSRFIRTTRMLSAETELRFPDGSRLRFFGEDEARALAHEVRRRNVFARHSWENQFYLQRANELANRTIIEVFRPGDPQCMSEDAEYVAALLEKLAVLSSTLVLPKNDLLRKLGSTSRLGTEIDFVIGPQFRFLRSRSRPAAPGQGICIDEKFSRRFSRCGFYELAEFCMTKSGLADRVIASVDWLFESRREHRLPASVVKTSIALESLLILSASEPLARSLSERAAFILSSAPDTRYEISRIVKRFYEARSDVVHGSRRKAGKLTPSLVEAVDRLSVLLQLMIASNRRLWPSAEALGEWCETQRWGTPSTEVNVPFSRIYLRNAISLSKKGS